MRVTADTNVLIRAAVMDDPVQAAIASKALKKAELIAISTPCLCEFVWVLRGVYHFDDAACSTAIRALLATRNAAMDRPAVEAGLALLESGGDFADGVMSHEGKWLARIFHRSRPKTMTAPPFMPEN